MSDMVTESKVEPDQIDPDLRLQYTALRNEILKRIELRHQFVVLSLSLAGIALSLGISTPIINLIYPPLATLICAGWTHNNLRIRQMAHYISNQIEDALPGLGWDTHRKSIDAETSVFGWSLELLSAAGIFVVTELIAIVIGILEFGFGAVEWFLLVISVLSFAWLLFLVVGYRRRHVSYV
jgi:hypothetical protein